MGATSAPPAGPLANSGTIAVGAGSTLTFNGDVSGAGAHIGNGGTVVLAPDSPQVQAVQRARTAGHEHIGCDRHAVDGDVALPKSTPAHRLELVAGAGFEPATFRL